MCVGLSPREGQCGCEGVCVKEDVYVCEGVRVSVREGVCVCEGVRVSVCEGGKAVCEGGSE